MAEYIKRDDIIAEIDKGFHETDPTGEEQFGFLKCRKIAREIPAEDVSPVRHGRWIYHAETIHTLAHTRCSVCSSIRYEHYVNDFRFCPSCGARMDGGGG